MNRTTIKEQRQLFINLRDQEVNRLTAFIEAERVNLETVNDAKIRHSREIQIRDAEIAIKRIETAASAALGKLIDAHTHCYGGYTDNREDLTPDARYCDN